MKTLDLFMSEWVLFKFSNRLKFAIKVSLSLSLAYVIALGMGWNDASTSAVTVMLIAGSGGVGESIQKGIIRIVGTIIGAAIGLSLIALFAQERLLYLISLSLVISIIIYLYYAYQGDSTVFLLTAMTTMMVYSSGVEDAFMYGIDKTYITIFAIAIYTLVGVFIWPVKGKKNKKEKIEFIWLDPEYFKAVLQLFLVFWFATLLWIYLNPPGGFFIVIFATVLGLFTTFTPLRPSMLMILFSIGFVFASLMYIFVLPHLVYGWELMLFLFFYTFIAFYFINPKITIFFLFGLFVINIQNTMSYSFDIFLMKLLVFYIFLIILMLFHNFPFSTKPEYLFSVLKKRFFKHATALKSLEKKELNWIDKKRQKYHQLQLHVSSKKLMLWGSKIDTNYFTLTSSEQILAFSTACQNYTLNTKSLQSCYETMQDINWNNLKENRF